MGCKLAGIIVGGQFDRHPQVAGVGSAAAAAEAQSSSSNEDLLRVPHKQILLLAPSHWLRTPRGRDDT